MVNRSINVLFTLLLAFVLLALGNATQTHLNNGSSSINNQEIIVSHRVQSSLRRLVREHAVLSQGDPNSDAVKSYSTTNNNKFTSPKNKQNVERRTQDMEEILNEMSHKDPSQWEPTEWVIFILFMSLFGWLGCCVFSMCCCGRGRGGGSNLLGWLFCWEFCCRGGQDVDACCDNYIWT